MLRWVAASAALLVSLAACDDCGGAGRRTQAEAQQLLDLADLLDTYDPPAVRNELLAAMTAIEPSEAALLDLRDACVRGHRALLEAEEQQAAARAALERLTGGDPEALIGPQDQSVVEESLRRSNEAIERARPDLLRCESDRSMLRRRYL